MDEHCDQGQSDPGKGVRGALLAVLAEPPVTPKPTSSTTSSSTSRTASVCALPPLRKKTASGTCWKPSEETCSPARPSSGDQDATECSASVPAMPGFPASMQPWRDFWRPSPTAKLHRSKARFWPSWAEWRRLIPQEPRVSPRQQNAPGTPGAQGPTAKSGFITTDRKPSVTGGRPLWRPGPGTRGQPEGTIDIQSPSSPTPGLRRSRWPSRRESKGAFEPHLHLATGWTFNPGAVEGPCWLR